MHPATGNALWLLLHSYAHALPEGPLTDEAQRQATAFLAAFDAAVALASSHTCPCARHWQTLRHNRPPDLTTRRAFYWWTVSIHDDVNRKLGKPVIGEPP